MLPELEDLFSLTMWRSADGFTVGVQRQAGDLVRYATARTANEAISLAIGSLVAVVAPPPY